MIDLYPFNGYTVVVLGLSDAGILSARSLQESDVTVWAWDDSKAVRDDAEKQGVTLMDLATIDWREPVSMVIEPDIPHTDKNSHPYVSAAKEANCEVISDVELLARVQREAAYIGVCGHHNRHLAVDLIGYVLEVCGRDVDSTGIDNSPVHDLRPIGLEGAYVIDMPTGKIDSTVSITFDVAVWVNFDEDSLPDGVLVDDEISAMSWIFHRQTSPKTALINVDDPVGLRMYEKLKNIENKTLIPLSTTEKHSWGISVVGGWLIDDRENSAVEVIDLNETTTFKNGENHGAAIAAYACGVAIGLQPHAVMACLNSYEVS